MTRNRAAMIRDLLRAGLSRRKVTAMLRDEGWFEGHTQTQALAEVGATDRKRKRKIQKEWETHQ